jgi:hypothetical protein
METLIKQISDNLIHLFNFLKIATNTMKPQSGMVSTVRLLFPVRFRLMLLSVCMMAIILQQTARAMAVQSITTRP